MTIDFSTLRALAGDLPGGKALDGLRAAGETRFSELGVPTPRDEDWKYTSLRGISAKSYVMAAAEQPAVDLPEPLSAVRLVFVNGILNADASQFNALPDGVRVMPMADALAANEAGIDQLGHIQPDAPNAMASLNQGLFRNGFFVSLAAGVSLDVPVEIVFMGSGAETLSLPRNLITLAAGAKATVVERYLSDADATALSNSATEISLAEDAELDYCLIQNLGKKAAHIGACWVQQAARSRLNSFAISMGGMITRNELQTSLNADEAHAECLGLYVGNGRSHLDNHTTIRHASPNCTSRELYKGILDDRARGVFHGRIVVEKDAQLTNSEQENPNLLLSRDAEIDTKPQLEIYADDVKCSHGATVGQLDAKQIFYLQSRGINKAQAEQLLTYAFAAEVVEALPIEALCHEIERELAKTLVSADFAAELEA